MLLNDGRGGWDNDVRCRDDHDQKFYPICYGVFLGSDIDCVLPAGLFRHRVSSDRGGGGDDGRHRDNYQKDHVFLGTGLDLHPRARDHRHHVSNAHGDGGRHRDNYRKVHVFHELVAKNSSFMKFI